MSITRSESENPDQAKLSAMLNAWFDAFGNTPTTVATAISQTGDYAQTSVMLKDAADEIAGQRGVINSRILGRWIERHAEQRLGGLRFVKDGKTHGVARWRVLPTVERATSGGLGGLGGISAPEIPTVQDPALVVRFTKVDTYQATPRSNLFQRNTTGAALISAMPLRMRCFRSSFDVTRMCRRKVRAIFEKAHSIKLSQEPCLGV